MVFCVRQHITIEKHDLKYTYLALTLAPLLNVALAAQANETTSSDPIERIEVAGQALKSKNLSIKNTTVNGPFGDNLALQDIARSVTPISKELIEQLNITTLHDVLAVSPNTYAASGFGAPSLPTIRGQLGELFQDGTRRQAGNNGFGVPLSFNAIEQIDVVKGAPPVLFGSSQRNGGFVNTSCSVDPCLCGISAWRSGDHNGLFKVSRWRQQWWHNQDQVTHGQYSFGKESRPAQRSPHRHQHQPPLPRAQLHSQGRGSHRQR